MIFVYRVKQTHGFDIQVSSLSVKRPKEANEGPGITIDSLAEREVSHRDCGDLGLNPLPQNSLPY